MEDYNKGLKWGGDQDKIEYIMSIKQSIVTVFGPLLLQVVLVFFISAIDPCNNNPGCMAGSVTTYLVILILPSSFIILSLITYLEYISCKLSYYKSLTINIILASIPFVFVLVLIV